jgi:wobble nucleotide-excising tRNase
VKLSELEERAETVFGPPVAPEPPIAPLTTDRLVGLESNPVLGKAVIGRADIDIGAMIQKLGNSDWVRRGLEFYSVNEQRCPFCQQAVAAERTRALREYFDETFERDIQAIAALAGSYRAASDQLRQSLDAMLANPSRFLDVESFKRERALLDAHLTVNLQRIATKQQEPSRRIELEPLGEPLEQIRGYIKAANTKIDEHNRIVANLAQERRTLTAQVWKYILGVELQDYLPEYDEKSARLQKAIQSLSEQIEEARRKHRAMTAAIRELEKQTTSIQPTIEAVNTLLAKAASKNKGGNSG